MNRTKIRADIISKAKVLVLENWIRILGIFCISFVMSMVISSIIGNLFIDTFEINLFGVEISLTAQILSLAVSVLIVPITIGTNAYLLLLVRAPTGQKPSILNVFEWIGDTKKLKRAFKYAIVIILSQLVMIILIEIPFQYLYEEPLKIIAEEAELGTKAFEEYVSETVQESTLTEALDLFMEKMDSAGAFDLAKAVSVMGSAIIYFLVMVFFTPLSYIFIDKPEKKLFHCVKESIKIMKKHYFKFMLFLLNFIVFVIVPLLVFIAAGVGIFLSLPPFSLLSAVILMLMMTISMAWATFVSLQYMLSIVLFAEEVRKID